MYGKRRFSRKSSTRRTSGTFNRRRRYPLRKVAKRSFTKKFAVASYSKDIEKKYKNDVQLINGVSRMTPTVWNYQGIVAESDGNVAAYSFGTNTTSGTKVQNMLTGIASGAGVLQRIGNKVTPKYLKGTVTLIANAVDNTTVTAGTGEQIGNSTGARATFVRTTYRIVFVKDKQMNGSNTAVRWNDVFEPATSNGGPSSELSIQNMGRFQILYDRMIEMDGDDPQKIVPFMISGGKIGEVRFGSSAEMSTTDKQVLMVWSCWTGNCVMAGSAGVNVTPPILSSRYCFVDN